MDRKECFMALYVVLSGIIFGGSLLADLPPAGNFYVSPSGSDSHDGSMGSPFATIGRAKTAVRSLIAGGLTDDVVVYIRGGDYYLSSTLSFSASDSGTSAHSITYKAYPGEAVHVIGGMEVPTSWFAPVSDAGIIARLPAGMASYVQVADLSSHGVTNFGALSNRGFPWDYVPGALELFYNYDAMRLARWPNTGYEIAYEPPDSSTLKCEYTAGVGNSAHWGTAEAMWLHGFMSGYYGDALIPVSSVDTVNHIISVVNTGSGYAVFNWSITPIYYVFNLLEEIDQPGEWYLNRGTGKLYFYPPGDLTGAKLHFSMINEIMYFNGASYVNFEGLTLEMCRHFIVEVKSSQSVRFYQCVFRNAGTDAAYITGSSNCGLDSCVIYDTGDGGVTLRGGSRSTLTRSNNYLKNSHVHDLSRWGKTYKMAAYLRDCGNDVLHNLIHNLPAIAILFARTNENRIEYNEIYNVCQEVDDNGAIYSGRDWTSRGTTVHYNFIHHINRIPEAAVIASEGQSSVQGVFLDDGASGTSIYGNIFYDIDGSAVKLAGGRDNLTENNIYAYCPAAVQISRMINSPLFINSYNTLVSRLNGQPYTTPPWSVYYPSLVNILSDQPKEPKGNTVYGSIGDALSYGWVYEQVFDIYTLNPRQFLLESNNLENVDPCFVDEMNLDMNLDPCSPAYTIPGWEDIPFNQIGLEPTAPVVYVTVDGCGGANYVITGQCDPWAMIQSATIRQNAQDIASYLTVADNGAISGTIPRASVSTGAVTIDIVTVDPKGHESPVGSSNLYAYADVDVDCFVDMGDMDAMLLSWLMSCSGPGWCGGADINRDGIVNLEDYSLLILYWDDVPY